MIATHTRHVSPATSRRRAFTLLELIVSIGIVLLLASLIIAAVGGVRSTAARTESASSMRQLAAAYSAYSQDFRGQLMPGYLGSVSNGANSLAVEATLEDGTPLSPEDTASYVWRLAPYTDFAWKAFVTDYRSPDLISALSQELSTGTYGPGTVTSDAGFGIGRIPSFGLNTVFLGGDDTHGGAMVTDRNPWTGTDSEPLAATRMSAVKNPAQIISFAPTAYWGDADDDESTGLFSTPPTGYESLSERTTFGHPALMPPMLDWDPMTRAPMDEQWEVIENNLINTIGDFDAGGGVPFSRWGGKGEIPIAHLDGSVETSKLLDLQIDLRKWSPNAIGY